MKQFLGLLPLSDGVILLGTIHFTVTIDSFLINMTEINNSLFASWIFSVFSHMYTLLTWIIAFLGTYRKSISLIRLALNMWIFYAIIWFISMVCAMTDYLESYVCICQRCTESFWLYTNKWHIDKCLISTKLTSNENNDFHFKMLKNVLKHNAAQPKSESIDTNIHNFDYVILCSAIAISLLIFGIFILSNYLNELKELQSAETGPSELQLVKITSLILENNRQNIKVFKSNDICKENI